MRQYLADNPELANEIENKILTTLGITGDTVDSVTGEVADDYDPMEDAGF